MNLNDMSARDQEIWADTKQEQFDKLREEELKSKKNGGEKYEK